jgi:cysteine desulfurase
MNKSEEVIEGALRIGIGKFTTETEIEQASQIICEAIKDISMLMNSQQNVSSKELHQTPLLP